MDIGRALINFIQNSPTCYQAVDTVRSRLLEAEYQELTEWESWRCVPGGKYFCTRNQSSLIAFSLPEGVFAGFQIAAAHADSPGFRVKPKAELSDGHYVRLNTEPYGGAIYSTWMDRPLSVAGRVSVNREGRIENRLVTVDRDLLVIPQVAIHMNRKANEGAAFNAHQDMMPLYAGKDGEGSFLTVVAEAAGCEPSEIAGTDLYLCCRTPGAIWGAEGEFVSSPRLDDLQCAFALLEGFLQAVPGQASVYALFHNEEVGSLTAQGADSTFLSDVLHRIVYSMGGTEEDYLRRVAGSFLVSADNAHAVHPNHPEYADPANRVYMNGGIVIKFNGNQKYTSDGFTEAVFRQICAAAEAGVQTYTNRSDLPGGSTLGNLSNRHVSVPAVDIGLAQLAMHSAYETAGVRDTEALIRAMRTYFQCRLMREPDGGFRLEGGSV